MNAKQVVAKLKEALQTTELEEIRLKIGEAVLLASEPFEAGESESFTGQIVVSAVDEEDANHYGVDKKLIKGWAYNTHTADALAESASWYRKKR